MMHARISLVTSFRAAHCKPGHGVSPIVAYFSKFNLTSVVITIKLVAAVINYAGGFVTQNNFHLCQIFTAKARGLSL